VFKFKTQDGNLMTVNKRDASQENKVELEFQKARRVRHVDSQARRKKMA